MFYGKTFLIGNDEFVVLIEYTIKQRGFFDSYSELPELFVVGKELVTGTKLIEPESILRNNLDKCIRAKGVKKNELYISGIYSLNENDVLKELQNMTTEDIEKYVNNINKMKNVYAQIVSENETEKKDALSLYTELKSEKKRVKSITKYIRKQK